MCTGSFVTVGVTAAEFSSFTDSKYIGKIVKVVEPVMNGETSSGDSSMTSGRPPVCMCCTAQHQTRFGSFITSSGNLVFSPKGHFK